MDDQRQEEAAKLLLANATASNPKPASSVLRDAGYADASSTHIGQIVKTDSFQTLLDKFLPDDFLLGRHKELISTVNESVSERALELAYKLKKRLDREIDKDVIVQVKFTNAPSSADIDGETVDLLPRHESELLPNVFQSELDNKTSAEGQEQSA